MLERASLGMIFFSRCSVAVNCSSFLKLKVLCPPVLVQVHNLKRNKTKKWCDVASSEVQSI